MIEINVQQIPNQEFMRIIDNVRYTIKLRTFHDLTIADITINEKPVKNGVRVLANELLIPYKYLTKGGNFMFVCPNEDNPHYTKFGVTQQLVYLDDSEIKEIYG
jgi:hypothetical protein